MQIGKFPQPWDSKYLNLRLASGDQLTSAAAYIFLAKDNTLSSTLASKSYAYSIFESASVALITELAKSVIPCPPFVKPVDSTASDAPAPWAILATAFSSSLVSCPNLFIATTTGNPNPLMILMWCAKLGPPAVTASGLGCSKFLRATPP